MKKYIKYIMLFFTLSCEVIEPVNREIKISKSLYDSSTIICFNTYYISNSFYNNGNPYYEIFKFNMDGTIKKYLSFSEYDSIVDIIKGQKESFIVDKYQKDWRYSVSDSQITMEYIFRSPARTLGYFYGKINESGKILIDSSYFKIKGHNKTKSMDFNYLIPIGGSGR